MRTDGRHVNSVAVKCPFCCGGVHSHEWFDETDGLRTPTCGTPGAMYRIVIGTQERVEHMRTEYQTPHGVVSLVPLHFSYAYERDGNADVIGVVMSTTLGEFAVWLEADTAVELAGQLVEIVEHREMLRERYLQRADAAVTH